MKDFALHVQYPSIKYSPEARGLTVTFPVINIARKYNGIVLTSNLAKIERRLTLMFPFSYFRSNGGSHPSPLPIGLVN